MRCDMTVSPVVLRLVIIVVHQLLLGSVHDEHCEQTSRISLAGVGAHPVMRAGILEPRFARAINAGRLVIDLAANLTGEHVGVDEGRAGMTMRAGAPAGGVVDDKTDQPLSWQIRNRLVRSDCDGFAICCVVSVAGGRTLVRIRNVSNKAAD